MPFTFLFNVVIVDPSGKVIVTSRGFSTVVLPTTWIAAVVVVRNGRPQLDGELAASAIQHPDASGRRVGGCRKRSQGGQGQGAERAGDAGAERRTSTG